MLAIKRGATMSRQLQAEVEVNGSAEQVWEVLTDFAAYHEWNPFIVEAAGTPEPGRRLELHMRLTSRTTTFRPQVLEADPGRTLRWLGRLAPPLLAMIAKPTLASFHRMNQALKTRVEQPAATPTA